MFQQEPICALATPTGVGAIGVVRISGAGAIEIVNRVFFGKNLTQVKSHTIHFGTIRAAVADLQSGTTRPALIIDEVLVSVFRSPQSYTKEDTVEISCHGSDYIIRQILKVLVQHGARLAQPGEFTQRAFLNGQLDLVQAEAVADLIAADSAAMHRTALNQLRGGFSKQLAALREELIHFASMVELELDFGEEDVEFANRDDLKNLITSLQSSIAPLIASFDHGNALKEGIPVAIIGAPNVGKSTLLNALLNEDKAIVTDIAGTTRDVIEDVLFLNGTKFRIIDTAGIRDTTDVVESMGIERSKRAMNQADIVILLYEDDETLAQVEALVEGLEETKQVLWVRNKVDITSSPAPLLTGEGSSNSPLPSEEAALAEGRVRFEQKTIKSKALQLVEEGFKAMNYKIPPEVLENARNLRKTETNAEKYFWSILRNRQFNGLKFRRQHPVQEGFVIDFYCAEHRLAIELDGGVHLSKEQQMYDKMRDEELSRIYGITTIRFTNEMVFNDLSMVLERIISLTSPPTPLLTGEGSSKNPLLSGEEENKNPLLLGEGSSKNPLLSGEEENKNPLLLGEGRVRSLSISAKTGQGMEELKTAIHAFTHSKITHSQSVVTNLRHYQHLVKTQTALNNALQGLKAGITGDFLAQDIRLALYHLGEITGTIATDDLLANIFSKFCIGK
jgi:tRNA modification GTPase